MALWPNNRRDIPGFFPTNLWIHAYYTGHFIPWSQRHKSVFTQFANTSSIPRGSMPQVLVPPIRAGGISGNPEWLTLTNSSAALQEGRSIDGTSTCTLTNADASLSLTVQGSGDITLTLTVDSASLGAAINVSGSTACTLTNDPAILGALASLIVSPLTCTLSDSGTLTATGQLAGDILPYTELSPQNLAISVWDYLADNGFSAQDLLNIIAAATAGKVSGGPGSPVFRNIADTTDVITGTADASGNRTAASYTPP